MFADYLAIVISPCFNQITLIYIAVENLLFEIYV